VKLTRRTAGCAINSSTTSAASLGSFVTRLIAPAGMPASVSETTTAACGARALLRRLQHNRVAVSERRSHGADAEDHRRVPRCDPDDDPDRLAHRLCALSRDVRGDRLLVRCRVGVIGVVREHPGAELHVEHAPPQSAVRLLGDEGRDRSLTLHQELGSALQQTPPLARRHRRPLWKRPLGRLHRPDAV
jgi:hypothetical protein